MIKWEYLSFVITFNESYSDQSDYIYKINNLGHEGWELVSVNTVPDINWAKVTSEEQSLERLTFKRPAGRVWFGMLHT